ncbi:hypothetical protein L6452_18013 [Arctium lappa]|uniref:Uncharacterized protein n=1 Tax=Arctium lappa TaxID=4217 RepID=A0ACB9C597_ARCLA|nr:hypothetical protein L6452_18013 [Arctium lappa]
MSFSFLILYFRDKYKYGYINHKYGYINRIYLLQAKSINNKSRVMKRSIAYVVSPLSQFEGYDSIGCYNVKTQLNLVWFNCM